MRRCEPRRGSGGSCRRCGVCRHRGGRHAGWQAPWGRRSRARYRFVVSAPKVPDDRCVTRLRAGRRSRGAWIAIVGLEQSPGMQISRCVAGSGTRTAAALPHSLPAGSGVCKDTQGRCIAASLEQGFASRRVAVNARARGARELDRYRASACVMQGVPSQQARTSSCRCHVRKLATRVALDRGRTYRLAALADPPGTDRTVCTALP
jgi:hypothetical protein